jgi:GNAT superfamily N-acetyltransferase
MTTAMPPVVPPVAAPAPTEVVLRDGTPALVWPLLPTDGPALAQAFEELSDESRRARFLTWLPELSDSMLDLLVTRVDGVDHVALVLTALPAGGDARQVGVARLVRLPDDPAAADVAVTVSDDWHGRGVGRVLLDDLLARRPAGVEVLRTVVAAENDASLRLLAGAGTLTSRPAGSGVLDVEVRLRG